MLLYGVSTAGGQGREDLTRTQGWGTIRERETVNLGTQIYRKGKRGGTPKVKPIFSKETAKVLKGGIRKKGLERKQVVRWKG